MKTSIVLLLLFLSYSDGRIFLDNTISSKAINKALPIDLVGINVTWTFSSGINVTNVTMVVKKLETGEWAAVGLGQKQAMVNMIERLSHVLRKFYNNVLH